MKVDEILHSITKKFKKTIYKRFIHAVDQYQLIQEGDKIAVCISGGKDSFLLAKCMEVLKIHWNVDFDVEYICMDPGYLPKNRKLIEENAKKLGIDLKIFTSPIFGIVNEIDKSPCYLCARMRRGYLYEFAQSLGCNKIALGHHFDDAIDTTLLSMFYGGQFKTMMPKLKSTSHKGMELIRPLYMVREEDIIHWVKYNNLKFLNCACAVVQKVNEGMMSSKRKEIKQLIKTLKNSIPAVDNNIFKSLHSVCLDTVIGYKKGENMHTFLEDY